MNKQHLIFKNLKEIEEYWVEVAKGTLNPENETRVWKDYEEEIRLLRKLISDEAGKEAFCKIVDKTILGVIHSILVMFDGGDELADTLLIDIIDRSTEESLNPQKALHEKFFRYLYGLNT